MISATVSVVLMVVKIYLQEKAPMVKQLICNLCQTGLSNGTHLRRHQRSGYCRGYVKGMENAATHVAQTD